MIQDNEKSIGVSKSLLDAKEKLGQLYYDAKLIECPKNAVELTKLLTRIDSIEKNYNKRLQELKRSHKILRDSLPSCTDETIAKSRGLEPSEILPGDLRARCSVPGFRYRSNGDLKRNSIRRESQLQSSSSSTMKTLARRSKHLTAGQTSRSINNYSDYDNHKHVSNWLLKERHKIDTLLNEIERELVSNGIEFPSSARNKANFSFYRSNDPIHLKKHNFSELMQKSNNKNQRFSIKPGSNYFGIPAKEPQNTRIPKKPLGPRQSCMACQNVASFDAFKRTSRPIKKPVVRWNAAPRGRYERAPINKQELIDLLWTETQSCRWLKSSSRQNKSQLFSDVKSTSKLSSNSQISTRFSVNDGTGSGSIKSMVEFVKPLQYAENDNCQRMVDEFVKKMDSVIARRRLPNIPIPV